MLELGLNRSNQRRTADPRDAVNLKSDKFANRLFVKITESLSGTTLFGKVHVRQCSCIPDLPH